MPQHHTPATQLFHRICAAEPAVAERDHPPLHPNTRVTANPDHLLFDARSFALQLAAQPPAQLPKAIAAVGTNAAAQWKIHTAQLAAAQTIGPHEQTVRNTIADLLSGAPLRDPGLLTANTLLAAEREAFLKLAAMPATRARILHMLETGKPLRN
jgi:3-hydroxyacyl-CoA dehydrogenase